MMALAASQLCYSIKDGTPAAQVTDSGFQERLFGTLARLSGVSLLESGERW
jgi:hypothetical protein